MAGNYNLHINQGETFYRSFQWLLRDESGIDTPVDLSGYTGRCHIRRQPSNPLTISVPVIITDAAVGRFAISITNEETAAIQASGKGYDKTDKYTYDIELYSQDETYRVVNGYVYVSPEVTR